MPWPEDFSRLGLRFEAIAQCVRLTRQPGQAASDARSAGLIDPTTDPEKPQATRSTVGTSSMTRQRSQWPQRLLSMRSSVWK